MHVPDWLKISLVQSLKKRQWSYRSRYFLVIDALVKIPGINSDNYLQLISFWYTKAGYPMSLPHSHNSCIKFNVTTWHSEECLWLNIWRYSRHSEKNYLGDRCAYNQSWRVIANVTFILNSHIFKITNWANHVDVWIMQFLEKEEQTVLTSVSIIIP